MSVSITIHRGATQIGGSCIEIRYGAERLVLDAGRPLDADREARNLLPRTLDLNSPATVIFSHPHMDHWGLIGELPAHWRLITGEKSAALMRLTEGIFGRKIDRAIETWGSRDRSLIIGPFTITPYLTDHSAFDAYMLLIEVGGQRILYTGDFRVHGRKAKLVSQSVATLASSLDVLIMEGTNLKADKPLITEDELEEKYVELASGLSGQLYVNWSAQNLDRTVTLFRAARRTGRDLVVDLYGASVLEAVASGTRIPRPGPEFPDLKVLILNGGRRILERAGNSSLVDALAQSSAGISRRRLATRPSIVMLRDSMVSEMERGGVGFSADDAYAFSNWRGYLDEADPTTAWAKAKANGAKVLHLHTSGHAGARDLEAFASALAPRFLVPVHGIHWDDPGLSLPPTARLADGVQWFIPEGPSAARQ